MLTVSYSLLLMNCWDFCLLQGIPIESHPSKLVGSRGSKNRYFDFDKLAEVGTVFSHGIYIACSWLSMQFSAWFCANESDFIFLWQVTEVVTFNLNRIIDVNFYPVETARRSNMRHRPIGIGVQGLADTFILLGMAFDSAEVKSTSKLQSNYL